jgi:glycosyltransferase involved in cell wall biosynthesis
VIIHFDGVNLRSSSGPNTFAGRLAQKLFETGHSVAFDKGESSDVSLVFIEPTGQPLAPKVVQRLDGIWFKPDEFETKNVGIKGLYDRADAVVWQSKFDRNMTVKHWGFPGMHRDRFQGCVLEPMPDRVIHNGIASRPVREVTIPRLTEMRSIYNKIYVCSSNWHAQKRLRTNVELFDHLLKKHPNSCLIVMGDHPDHRVASPHVFYAGSVDPDTYLQVYAVADWMLHLAWADHCPNVVIEALSQGTPIACSEVGGTKELVGGYGVVLKEAPYGYELADYDNPPPIDVAQVDDLPRRKDLDYSSIADIDIGNVALQYVELCKRVLA